MRRAFSGPNQEWQEGKNSPSKGLFPMPTLLTVIGAAEGRCAFYMRRDVVVKPLLVVGPVLLSPYQQSVGDKTLPK